MRTLHMILFGVSLAGGCTAACGGQPFQTSGAELLYSPQSDSSATIMQPDAWPVEGSASLSEPADSASSLLWDASSPHSVDAGTYSDSQGEASPVVDRDAEACETGALCCKTEIVTALGMTETLTYVYACDGAIGWAKSYQVNGACFYPQCA